MWTVLRAVAASEKSQTVVICAEIEAEMAELDDDEKTLFLQELGIEESGLDKLIKASYALLGLSVFLTAGEPEVRACGVQTGYQGASGCRERSIPILKRDLSELRP